MTVRDLIDRLETTCKLVWWVANEDSRVIIKCGDIEYEPYQLSEIGDGNLIIDIKLLP